MPHIAAVSPSVRKGCYRQSTVLLAPSVALQANVRCRLSARHIPCARIIDLDGHYDFADLPIGFHVTVRFDNLGEGKGLIDAGFEVARGETIKDVLLRFGRRSGVGDHFEKGVGPAARAPYSKIVPPKEAAAASASMPLPPMGSKTIRAPLPPLISLTRAARSSSSVAITWSAPAARSAAFFFEVRVAAMLMAPSALAISIDAMPTLLLAAVIRTKSPLARISHRILLRSWQ